jgi:hypothetical protein
MSKKKVESEQAQGAELTTLAVVGDGAVAVESVDAEAMLRRVQDLKARVEQDGWELSEALYAVYKGAVYQAQGYASWNDYVEQALEFQIRKAQYYVAIQEWVRTFAPDFVEWVRACGLAKARLMIGRFSTDEATLWRNRLDGKTYREMEALLKGVDPEEGDGGSTGGEGGSEGGEGGSGKGDTTTTLRFALYPDQLKNVQTALERAKVQAETDKDGHALDLICTDYLGSTAHLKDKAAFLANAERALGLRIVAFKVAADDLGKAKVVYGADFMEAMEAALGDDE